MAVPADAGRSMRRILLILLAAGIAAAQSAIPVRLAHPDWRQIGGETFDAALASTATGPVEAVWFDPLGTRLYARTANGRLFETQDREQWTAVETAPEPAIRPEPAAETLPEPGALLRSQSGRLYALGRAVYRSDDGGLSWANLTAYRGESIIGDGLVDLAVSPADEDEIVVAGAYGVWRSVDGGQSWHGLNKSLPNLPVRRILSVPGQGQGTLVYLDGAGVFGWAPGERTAWLPAASTDFERQERLRAELSAALGQPLEAAAQVGDYRYAGDGAGRLWTSPDGGRNWRRTEFDEAGPVVRFYVVPGNPRVALAALGAATGDDGNGVHVLRTINGGLFWDDLTADLPASALGITADPATGAVYVATPRGLYFTIADLLAAAPPSGWTRIDTPSGDGPVYDVRLDETGNQLYVAIDGRGVFAAMAPHRFLAPAVANAADLRAHAASPGVLLSILGSQVASARAGSSNAPILAALEDQSQIQVPFDVSGDALSLELSTTGSERYRLGLPLVEAAPAILIDHDGTPLLIDADSGVLLDAMSPARPGSRVQVLATGLGRVDPPWPAGTPAPLENPPAVVTPVRIYLDREPIAATRATLAPGYVGFYLIEFTVPAIVNAGPAELYIEAAGQTSNRSRLYLEP